MTLLTLHMFCHDVNMTQLLLT